MKSVILDTNSYSHLASGDRKIQTEISNAESVSLSMISLGELFAGFLGGNRYKTNIDELEHFLNKYKVKIISITSDTAKIYGKITVSLYKKGNPIPTNDIWIASQTVETGSTLITYDRHFLKIPGLKLWPALK